MRPDVRSRVLLVSAELAALALVPLLLVLVHVLLPGGFREALVLRPAEPEPAALVTATVVHLDWTHLRGNVVGYAVGAGYAYLLCLHAGERRWFWLTTVTLLAVLPAAVNGSWVAIVTWAYPWLGLPSRGFSGVAAGFGGFLLVALVVFIARRRTSATARSAASAVVFVLLGTLLVRFGGGDRPLPAALVVVGLALSIGEPLRHAFRAGHPSSRAEWGSVAVDLTVTGWVLAVLVVLVVGLFPVDPVDGDSFTNVFAHGLGFIYGAVIARWGYRYWGTPPDRSGHR